MYKHNDDRMKTKLQVREQTRQTIVRDHIEPSYIRKVKDHIRNEDCWKVTGQVFETLSKIFVAIGGIVSFSSGYYNISY